MLPELTINSRKLDQRCFLIFGLLRISAQVKGLKKYFWRYLQDFEYIYKSLQNHNAYTKETGDILSMYIKYLEWMKKYCHHGFEIFYQSKPYGPENLAPWKKRLTMEMYGHNVE